MLGVQLSAGGAAPPSTGLPSITAAMHKAVSDERGTVQVLAQQLDDERAEGEIIVSSYEYSELTVFTCQTEFSFA